MTNVKEEERKNEFDIQIHHSFTHQSDHSKEGLYILAERLRLRRETKRQKNPPFTAVQYPLRWQRDKTLNGLSLITCGFLTANRDSES